MELAELGQVLLWNSDTFRFTPYIKGADYFLETRVCEIIKDIAKALQYRIVLTIKAQISAFEWNRSS